MKISDFLEGPSFGLFPSQLMRIMKITAFIITLFLLHASASSRAQISVVVNKASLQEILESISRQSGYDLVYSPFDLAGLKPITLNLSNVTLTTAIKAAFKGQPLVVEVADGTIMVRKKEQQSLLERITAAISDIEVYGRVLDEKGNGLAGATVKEKNGTKVTVSGQDGRFILKGIKEDAILSISFLGYKPREIKAGDDLSAIVLEINESKLDEIQVVAYGTTTRRLNTGSISTVKGSDIQNQPVTNPLAALDGRVPGMTVTQTSGLPGGTFKVEVRGRTAIDRRYTDDQPLFIIDGVPVSANNNVLSARGSALGSSNVRALNYGGLSALNTINPQDIESIEVLKDADATSIYGSRGANGVVLITTKKGGRKTKVNVSSYVGFSGETRRVEYLSTQEYVAMRKAAFHNDGVIPASGTAFDILVWDTTRYTNMAKMLAGETAVSNDGQISVSGGNERTSFISGGSLHREGSVMPGNRGDNKITAFTNINHTSANGRLSYLFSGNYSTYRSSLIANDPLYYSSLPPNLRMADADGNLLWNEGGINYSTNPLAVLHNDYDARVRNLIANTQIRYSAGRGLQMKLNAGFNQTNISEEQKVPFVSQNPNYYPVRTLYKNEGEYRSWLFEPQIEYLAKTSFGTFNFLAGASLNAIDNDAFALTASDFNSDKAMSSLANAQSVTATNSNSPYRYQALFGRINYNFSDKYLINISARRDGSSRFGPGEQYANFYSLGGGWIFTREKFLADNSWLSFGKIRASYGISGNDKIANYQYLDTWSTGNLYGGETGLLPSKLFNPDYRWEKANKFEVAIEAGFLHDRILVSAARYYNRSSNQLVQYRLPGTTGFSSIIMNLPAEIINRGLEFSATTVNIKGKSFSWSSSFNLTVPVNRVKAFPDLENSSYANSVVIGQSLNVIYNYRFTGVNPATGLYTFEDVNNDQVLDNKDYCVSGDTDPEFYGGFQNSLSYRGFSLDILFSFRKQTGRNYLGSLSGMPGSMRNIPRAVTGFWESPEKPGALQRLSSSTGEPSTAFNNFQTFSSGVFSDASFLRLKNAAFSYTLPPAVLKKTGVSGSKIFLQAQNLFTITGYKIGDPETQSITRTGPLQTICVGIQFTF